MPSKGSQRSVEAAKTSSSRQKRSGTRRVKGDPAGSVRVWGEAGVTISITDSPPQFVKVLFGHERIAPDDSLATLTRVTALIDEYNETVVEKQAKKYARLVRALQGGKPQRKTRRASA